MKDWRKNGRVSFQREHLEVDEETGEILREIESGYVAPPRYKMPFVRDHSVLEMEVGLRPVELLLLRELCRQMDYSNEVQFTGSQRGTFCKRTGCSAGAVKNALTGLIEFGLLRRERRGVYWVNPYYSAKGEWENIRKLLGQAAYDDAGRLKRVVIK